MDAMPFPWALWLCRCVQTTAAVLLSGTAVLRLLALGTGLARAERWPRLAWASWAAVLVAGVFLLGLTAAEMSGEPLSQILTNGSVAQVLGGTRFGAVWIWRMGLLAGWLLVRWSAAGSGRRTWPSVPVVLEAGELLLDAALLVSLVLAGHAPASDKSAWLLPVNVGHVLAAGAWPGGLLPLGLLLARARRDATLLPAAVTVARRFSRLSVVAVGLLAFSGVLSGMGMVGSLAALWSSTYGWLLLCKATLFAAMIGLGAVNRRMVQRQPDAAEPAQAVRRLWRNVAWECALAVGVLLATEALATSEPPMPPATAAAWPCRAVPYLPSFPHHDFSLRSNSNLHPTNSSDPTMKKLPSHLYGFASGSWGKFAFATLCGKALTLSLLHAQEPLASGVKVAGAYVRAVPPNATATAAFMTLVNDIDRPVRLVGGSAPFAGMAGPMVTTHEEHDGTMAVGMKDVPAHGKLALRPGGDHLMHSAHVYLIDKAGRWRAMYHHDQLPERNKLAADLAHYAEE